jgi:hypothetical protein
VQTRNNRLIFTAKIPESTNHGISKYMEIARLAQIKAAMPFILRMEQSNVRELFLNGPELSIESISPRIRICRTPTDFDIFRYCSLFQSVPSANRIGRRISAIVYDEGQRKGPILMGTIGLASSMYSVAARDQHLGWVGKDARILKDSGLKRIMDLALCMAVPPYSFLLGGKLMALLAISDPLRTEFRKKYGTSLLGLGTSCATGIHCPIFNRIMVRPGGLYHHIGETSGYTTSFFGAETVRAARALKSIPNANSAEQLSLRPMRMLNDALRLCGLPYEPLVRLGLRKAVYFGVLSQKALVYLRKGKHQNLRENLSASDAISYWKTVFVSKRIHHPDALKLIKAFKVEHLVPGGKAGS